MAQMNHLSDNQLRVTLRTKNGALVNPLEVWVRVHLRSGGKEFVAVNDPTGEDTKNCHIDKETGKLMLDIPKGKLFTGQLEYMTVYREDCKFFADGYKHTVANKYKQTGIEVV